MRDLPPALRRYLYVVWGLALVIASICFYAPPLKDPYLPVWPHNILILLLFTLLAIIAELKPTSYNKNYSQTVTTAIFISAIFILPPFSVVLLAVVGNSISDVLYKKPWYKTCSNAAFGAISFGTTALLVQMFRLSPVQPRDIPDIVQILFVFLVYTVLSVSLVGSAVALANGCTIMSMWRDALTFFNAYDIALLPYGLILALLWQSNHWYFFVGLLPLVAMQRWFADQAGLLKEQAATARLAEQQRRIQEAMTMLLSTKDVGSQLDTLLQHVMEVFPVDQALVILWGEHNEPDQVFTRGREDDGFKLSLDVWRDQLKRYSDEQRLVRLRHSAMLGGAEEQAVLFVPLRTPEDIVGCLMLVEHTALTLHEQEERLIETFAAQAALSIYQARLIARLEESQVQLMESARLATVGTLATGIAHDINNLLGAISGSAQLGLLDPDPQEHQSMFQAIANTTQKGVSIAHGLLTFVHQQQAKRELANVREAIDPVLAMLQPEFRRANIQVVRNFMPVPSIECDIGMLLQVVMNLVTNAIDAMYPDGGTLTISLDNDRDQVRLSVSDTGAGIPDHIRTRIFDPFFTSKTGNSAKLHGGTGIGLTMTQTIVRDHGGTIDVITEPGQGTTMVVCLPITRRHPEALPAARASAQPKLHAIVIDDEPKVAEALSSILTLQGHTAEWFTEPLEALEAMHHEPVDIIFADLRMPKMDGLTLLQKVKQCIPSAIRVLITGYMDTDVVEQAKQLGASAVIPKPFSYHEIRAFVDGVDMHTAS
jgi:two-component system NtrC family sensor kinase